MVNKVVGSGIKEISVEGTALLNGKKEVALCRKKKRFVRGKSPERRKGVRIGN